MYLSKCKIQIEKIAEWKGELAMDTNPFTFGNPISDPTRFFGRQDEVDRIFSRLCNAEFESSSLVGERRIGKTSLINYLKDERVRQKYGLTPDKYMFIYLDLLRVNEATTPAVLWKWLIEKMAECCQDTKVRFMLEEFSKTTPIDSFTLPDLFSDIGKNGQHVVFLLDEFDSIIKNKNFNLSFFHILRVLAIQRTLALVTSTRQDLIDLCHSDISSSPFFNIFVPIYLRPFARDEARELIETLLWGKSVRLAEADFEVIFHLGGTHPYFLQMACSCLFEERSKPFFLYSSYFSLRKKFEEIARSQFQNYWDSQNSTGQERIVLATLALFEWQNKTPKSSFFKRKKLQHPYHGHSNQALERLERRGLVVQRDGQYSLFNESFARWLYKEITDITHDQESYEDWRASNKPLMDHLSTTAKKEMGKALPKISSKYRELIITWVSDPRNLAIAVELFKAKLHIR
jgi:hypothetical protein